MKRALNLLRPGLAYRREKFETGLRASGFKVVDHIHDPRPGDVLLIWNRYGHFHERATVFERAGGTVIVAENGYVRDQIDGKWFALSIGHHAGAGKWNVGGPERWDRLGVELQPWRADGGEDVILGQRGIGEHGIASPPGWAESLLRNKVGHRIRQHPGNEPARIPLEEDLRNARCVITWHSAAALSALIMGIPVFTAFDKWVGAQACARISSYPKVKRSDEDRLQTFRRLIWAQWELREIENGEAFRFLLPDS